MITCSNTETSDVVIDNGPDQSLGLKRGGESTIETDNRSTEQEGNMDPIDMLMPVLGRHLVVEQGRQSTFWHRWSW